MCLPLRQSPTVSQFLLQNVSIHLGVLNKTVSLESPVKRIVAHRHGQSTNETAPVTTTSAPSNRTVAKEAVIAEDGHVGGEGWEEELHGGNTSVESEGAREDSARTSGLRLNSSLGRAEAEGGAGVEGAEAAYGSGARVMSSQERPPFCGRSFLLQGSTGSRCSVSRISVWGGGGIGGLSRVPYKQWILN